MRELCPQPRPRRVQKQVEQQRVANDLQLLIETANAPIFGIDTEGLVNEWNRKAAEITGYSKEEVMGQDLVRKFITSEYQTSVDEVLVSALSGRETANFEFTYPVDKALSWRRIADDLLGMPTWLCSECVADAW